ncbi:endonuclease [Pelobates cultripes]|uniref:Endonuclease, partial n=1 Tax=Pelobates cultripes TaxID=61616 RepID=A0AAD1RHI4_PELCU|nr:endonuclease [Pelobates cultripes]
MTIPHPMRQWTWKLNPLLLHDKQVINKIAKTLIDYFELNTNRKTSPVSLWAAHKAVVRRHILNLATAKKRQQQQPLTGALTELCSLEIRHKRNPQPTTFTQVNEIRD